MSREKKNGCKKLPTDWILLATAILNLVDIVVEVVKHITE